MKKVFCVFFIATIILILTGCKNAVKELTCTSEDIEINIEEKLVVNYDDDKILNAEKTMLFEESETASLYYPVFVSKYENAKLDDKKITIEFNAKELEEEYGTFEGTMEEKIAQLKEALEAKGSTCK